MEVRRAAVRTKNKNAEIVTGIGGRRKLPPAPLPTPYTEAENKAYAAMLRRRLQHRAYLQRKLKETKRANALKKENLRLGSQTNIGKDDTPFSHGKISNA